MTRKIFGLVCDFCRRFVDYADEKGVEKWIIVSIRKDKQKLYGYEYASFEYCSPECSEAHFKENREIK